MLHLTVPADDPVEARPPREAPEAKPRMSSASLRAAAARVQRQAAQAAGPPRERLAPLKPPPNVVPESEVALDYDPFVDDGLAFASQFSGFGEGQGFIGYPALAELSQRPEFRRFSEIFADHMTRKFIKLVSASDEPQTTRIKLLVDAMEKFDLRGTLRQLALVDGLYGRAHLYPDLGPEAKLDSAAPLLLDRATLGLHQLRGFKVIEPFWTYPARYDARDPTADDFYKPAAWYLMGKEYHRTRLLTFVSSPVPDILKPTYGFGGMSLTQLVKPYVDNWVRTRQNVSDAIEQFAQAVLATNMESTLTGGAGDDLDARLALFNAVRSFRGVMSIDKDTETYQYVSMPLGSLDKLQAQAQEQMCSVAGTPLIIYLGITPSGLNATSDGEVRVFFDTVAGRQTRFYGPHMKFLLDLLMLSELGEIHPDLSYKFETLWQMSETEFATVRSTNATTAKTLIDAGVLHPAEERERLAGEEDGLYQGLDPDDVPEPAPAPEPGSFGSGGEEGDQPPGDPERQGPGGTENEGGQPKDGADPTVNKEEI